MTEGAIMRGLNWLKAVQDEDGGWGNKDKDDQGNPKKTDRNAMTGMALLPTLDTANCKTRQLSAQPFKKVSIFSQALRPTLQSRVVQVPTPTQFVPMHFAKHIP